MRAIIVNVLRGWILFLLIAVPGAAFDLPISLTVRETAGLERVGEVVHNGIPLSKDSGITDAQALSIQGAPAQFEVLSRWGGSLDDTSKPIQWLLVSFPATVNAGQSRTYTLAQGGNGAPTSPLMVSETGVDITVNTGPGGGKFVVSKQSFNVFREIRWIDAAGNEGPALVDSSLGRSLISVNGHGDMVAQAPDQVVREHEGPLFITLKVSGLYDNPPPGGNALRYVARYTFRAGSPVAEVDFVYVWPGARDGGTTSYEIGSAADGGRGACLLLDRVSLSVPLAFSGALTGYASATDAATASGPLSTGQSVSLAQRRRSGMRALPAYEMRLAASLSSGGFAERPFVALANAQGGLGASIQKMHLYEPQSIVAEPGQFTVNVVAEPQWLGPVMGAFAKIGFSAVRPGLFNEARSRALAVLDHPLTAWPDQAHVARTKALGDLWDGTPDAAASTYLERLRTITQNTFSGIQSEGMHGFMSYGYGPRQWSGTKEFGDETSRWDGYLFGSTLTDYHSTFANVTRFFALTGDSRWLSDLSFPAARRQINTQVVQAGPRGGWAPIGYGFYRTDHNSSHSYFENLYLYYYLTGDRRVPEVLSLAESRVKNTAAIPERSSSQVGNIGWFMGHVTTDGAYLEAYRNRLRNIVSRHLALVTQAGKEYAFFASATLPDGSGSLLTDSGLWLLSLYTVSDFWQFYLEYGDEPLGTDANGEPIRISRIFKSFHNTLWEFGATSAGGNGSASGEWALELTASWTGPRLGGQLQSVACNCGIGEPTLYETGKAVTIPVSFRAAILNPGDPEAADMRAKGRQMYDYVYRSNGGTCNPASYSGGFRWDKISGECYIRSHPVVGYFTNSPNGPAEPPLPFRPRRLRVRVP